MILVANAVVCGDWKVVESTKPLITLVYHLWHSLHNHFQFLTEQQTCIEKSASVQLLDLFGEL